MERFGFIWGQGRTSVINEKLVPRVGGLGGGLCVSTTLRVTLRGLNGSVLFQF